MNSGARSDAHERALQTFHVEAQEMVQQMEQCLLALEEDPADREVLNALFRSVHTIKGSGSLFGLDALVRFTHQVEGVLDRLRGGAIQHDHDLGSVMLNCADQIAALLAHARQDPDGDPSPAVQAQSDHLLQLLRPYTDGKAGIDSKGMVPVAAATKTAPAADGVWHISLRFAEDSFLHGIDPLATVKYLGSLGELLLVETFDRTLPPLSGLNPENCYLGFEIRLKTKVDEQQLNDAFEFIQDSCRIHLIPPAHGHDYYARLIEALPEDAERLGDILVACGAITRAQLNMALSRQYAEAAMTDETRPLGSILVEQGQVDAKVVDVALKKQSAARERTEETRFFRVQADKLDALINTVGELVIMGSTAKMQAHDRGDAGLVETTHHMALLVEEIRNGTLALRMVAIGESFTRYKRIVRDIASSLHKEVRLEIEGGDTELDKSVVEKIGDPLMHLVRNSLDHGLEPPEERKRAGKSEEGRLLLSAWHDSGSIVIQVADDGRGIDPDKIMKRATERGLVAAGAVMDRDDILGLIFEPGFSTAEQVSDLSGRGVGMDVVKRNIEALRGTVKITSEVGVGTAMTIRLPLTLAIIDGFLVRCGRSSFVIPLEHVEECIAGAGAIVAGAASGVIDRRGVPLPVLNVGRLLNVPGASAARPSIVVVRSGDIRIGLLVDHLIGEHQTVIKPLGQLFEHLRYAAGSTVLGNGGVAIILDVAALVGRAVASKQNISTSSAVPRLTAMSE